MEKRRCQIHHIDEDSSNNVFDNLALICLHCHSDAHSNGAFVRDLTPELIRLYNTSWREIVKYKISPHTLNSNSSELDAEAFLEAGLDCHHWKIHFMGIAGSDLPSGREGQFTDVWDLFAELWIPKYTKDNYQKFLPLFDQGLLWVQQRFDRLIQLFADVLPPDFRANLVRANRQLNVERSAYLHFANMATHENSNIFFYARFIGVIRILREIARDADARRKSATSLDQDK